MCNSPDHDSVFGRVKGVRLYTVGEFTCQTRRERDNERESVLPYNTGQTVETEEIQLTFKNECQSSF